jgi:hypothetical protein
MEADSGSKVQANSLWQWRSLFLFATTALFAAVIGISELVSSFPVTDSFVHMFWPVCVLGIIVTMTWLVLCWRHGKDSTDRSAASVVGHRLFDQLLPFMLLSIWSLLLYSWANAKTPSLPLGWALWPIVAVSVIITVVFLVYPAFRSS